MVQGCHNCPRGIGDWCATCSRVRHDEERARREAKANLAILAATEAEPPTKATRLPEWAEQALRLAIAQFSQLEPMETLMAWHALRGGSPKTFGALTANLAAEIQARGGQVSRSYAHAKWKSAVRRCPALAAVRQWDAHAHFNSKAKKAPNHG